MSKPEHDKLRKGFKDKDDAELEQLMNGRTPQDDVHVVAKTMLADRARKRANRVLIFQFLGHGLPSWLSLIVSIIALLVSFIALWKTAN